MQSRKASIVEVVTNTAIGYVIAITSQVVIFPMFDVYIPFSDNLLMGLYFTVVSLIRGYVVRRFFCKK